MPAVMRSLLIVALLGVGCGSEIGDSCVISSDCDPNGQRYCDISSKEGYCTIQGCGFDTCPEESACIRFFTGNFENRPCESTSQCTLDELCSLEGHCVPRSSEVRFCMRTCGGSGDCRDGYECRNLDLQIEHGGEPVLAPGVEIDSSAPKFCAPALR
jgi:hypothetical protein